MEASRINLYDEEIEASLNPSFVRKSLGLSKQALAGLVLRGVIVPSLDGKITESSYLLVKACLKGVRIKYADRKEAIDLIGKPAFNSLIRSGELKIWRAFEMDLCEKAELLKLAAGIEANGQWRKFEKKREAKKDLHVLGKKIMARVQDNKKNETNATNEQLGEEERKFSSRYKRGCWATVLADYLGITRSSMKSYMRRRVINGRKRKDKKGHQAWWIGQPEMIRVIVLVRNWIQVSDVIRQYDITHDPMVRYVLDGHFGEYRIDLAGALCISRSEIDDTFQERVNRIGKDQLQGSWRKSHTLLPDEHFTVDLVKLCGFQYHNIKLWLTNKDLPYRKSGRFYVVRESDLIRFVLKVIRGETTVRFESVEPALFSFLFTKDENISQQTEAALKLRTEGK